MNTLLHICPRTAWDEAQQRGDYRADSLGTEGFIHCSTPAQVAGTANLLFRGRTGLVLLVIDGDRVAAPIRYEDAGSGHIFPHVYGPLNLEAVVEVREFTPDADGTFVAPDFTAPACDGRRQVEGRARGRDRARLRSRSSPLRRES